MTSRPVVFTVRGEPAAQPRPRVFRNGGVRTDNPASLRWKRSIAWAFRAAAVGLAPPAFGSGPIALTLTFWLARPKTVERSSPSVKPDLDNLVKAVADALNKIAWADDGQIVRIEAEKRYVRGDDAEGVTILIESAEK